MNIAKFYKNKSISLILISLLFVNSFLNLKEIFFIQNVSFKKTITTQFVLSEKENNQYETTSIEEEICSNDIRFSNNTYFAWKIYQDLYLVQTIQPAYYSNNLFTKITYFTKEIIFIENDSIIYSFFHKNKSIRAPPFV